MPGNNTPPRHQILSGRDLHGTALAPIWHPVAAPPAPADITVDPTAPPDPPSCVRTLQGAIDLLLLLGASAPCHIALTPGFHEGPVHIPAEAPPLRITGAGQERTVLAARIDAAMSGCDYAQRFAALAACTALPLRAAFARIAARERIGTGNSAVLRVARDDTRLSHFTIRNDYACDRTDAAPPGAEPDAEGRFAQGQHQAVALHIAGADRVHLCGLYLSSFQDTLYLQAPRTGIARALFESCCIEGDVDFIFGGATALFERCEIRTRGARGAQSWATAPSTSLHLPHGFVFARCDFTHDGAEAGRDGRSFLGRQWFEGVRASPYGAEGAGFECRAGDVNRLAPPLGWISRQTLEAVGKCHLRDCTIGDHIAASPWDDWASKGPRYRPVQIRARDFLKGLGPWLSRNGLDYGWMNPEEVWLSVD
ncbi:pectinesterase [Poseidonocella pacifica]|uniref:Pectinesterase n=1 Tax=Poseidonocella pacifica TaxID=871651 RepID=A0A1I0XJF4_9RHOB|nr:pectinesterase family protein [Poseidonocella pacifica]SFB01121.1 pectinesterase [Poseidonocella pacifica]